MQPLGSSGNKLPVSEQRYDPTGLPAGYGASNNFTFAPSGEAWFQVAYPELSSNGQACNSVATLDVTPRMSTGVFAISNGLTVMDCPSSYDLSVSKVYEGPPPP